jgi:TRAP-type C4-dicarboxylate transport system substrate-binding protein
MMPRAVRRPWILGVVVATALVVLITPMREARAETTTLKFATLLPQNSPWGRELKKWASLVTSDTGGDLVIDFEWSAQAGDEVLMVQKVRAGQLDGAIVSAMGLAQTGVTDALLFQLPGRFTDWAKLDSVQEVVGPDIEKEFEARGFVNLGWGGAGAIHAMSVGYEVHRPRDLQGKATFIVAGDPIQPVLLSSIGGITPRTLALTEILPALAGGAITFLAVSPLLAEQLQWAARITHVSADPIGFAVGGFLASGPRMLALPQRFKDVMKARGTALQGKLQPLVRELDAKAFARMKANKVVYALTDAEKNEWRSVFDDVAMKLRGTVFTPAIFDRVMQLTSAP